MLLFEAGLATGLSRFLAPLIALLVVAAAALLLERRGEVWLALVAILGFALGGVAREQAARSCAAVLPGGELTVTIRLLEPAGDGVVAAAVPISSCSGAITVRTHSSRLLPAGTSWTARGRWIPIARFAGRRDGMLVAAELLPQPGEPGPVARARTWLAHTTLRLYGERAGLVDALLVGSRGGIEPSLNAAFARSGLVHLLSISGFHVGVLFGWTLLLLRSLRLGRTWASGLATAVVLGYTAWLGWPAPATRAALLCAAAAWSFARQRHPAPMALLGLTCLGVTLLDPWALFELSAWLSAAAFWGALRFTRWSDRSIGRAAGWRMLFASLGATLSTAPFTAAAFGSVAVVGIGLNFVAIPLAGLAVPAVLASVLLAPVPVLAGALAAGGGLGLAALEWLARAGSSLPLAAVPMAPGPAAALPWAMLLLAVLWAMGRRNTSRRAALSIGWGLGLAGVLGMLPLLRPLPADSGNGLALHFLSVGQGDAALLKTAHGHWILVDAGPADQRRDAGREVVLPFLVRHGVTRLALFVLSHAHQDHVGGALAVLRKVSADLVLEPAEPVREPHYLGLLELAAEQGMRWAPGRAGDSLQLDGVTLRVLHPDTTWVHWREDLNDDSVVLLIRSGAFEAVLAGDLGVKAESLLAGRVGRVDLLKVGHHGSATSSGPAWLAELRPKAAIVSVGPNRYGHPAASALARLAAAGVSVWRTDRDGTVSVTVGDSSMTLRGRRATWQYPLRP